MKLRRIGSLNKVMILIIKRDLLLNLTPFKASDIKLRQRLLDQFLRRLELRQQAREHYPPIQWREFLYMLTA